MSIITGKRAVFEALSSDQRVERVFVGFGVQDSEMAKIHAAARKSGIKIQQIPRQEFDSRFGRGAQYVAALVADIDGFPFGQVQPDDIPHVLIVDHIEDPHNFGAILRTSEALGVACVIYAKDRQVQITPTVMAVSTGAVNHLKMVRVSNIAQSVRELKKRGYLIIGADEKAYTPVSDSRTSGPRALVLGNEGKGLSPIVKSLVDVSVAIPLKGHIESLNVSVAAGILIWTQFA